MIEKHYDTFSRALGVFQDTFNIFLEEIEAEGMKSEHIDTWHYTIANVFLRHHEIKRLMDTEYEIKELDSALQYLSEGIDEIFAIGEEDMYSHNLEKALEWQTILWNRCIKIKQQITYLRRELERIGFEVIQ